MTNFQESLSSRAVKGGFWVFSLRIIQLIFQIIKLIILARILNPYDFGLMGIALLTIAVLETFSQTGFQSALIQKKKDIKSYLDVAWTILALRGFILFAILYLIAPSIAVFFRVPEARLIIQIIGISVLFQALTNIGVIYFQKELEFSKEFFYQGSGTLADFIVAVSAAIILKNVWALVFGLLVGKVVRCIVSYLIHPYRPRFHLNLEKIKELFSFGKWVLGSSILVFLLTQGDDAFVGRILGATMLGFYQMAYRISNIPATEITHVISQVTFPVYSKLQDNVSKLREAYLRVLQVTTFLSFPIAGLIFVFASDFTKIFLGDKWMSMVPAMQTLVLWGIIRSVGATTGPIFYSIGRPKVAAKLQFIQLSLLIISIYPLTTRIGILGTSLSVVFAAFITNILGACIVVRVTRCRMQDFSRIISIPLINTAIAILFILAIKRYWITSVELPGLMLLTIFAFAIYISMTYLFDKFLNYKAMSMVKNSALVFIKR